MIKIKSIFLLSVSLFIVTFILAHEFWLQPNKFMYKRNEPINIKFMVGEGFSGENWAGSKTRINFLKLLISNTVTDLSSFIGSVKGDSLQFSIAEEGTALVIFNSNNSFIKLEAEKFNAYLQEDGLTNVLNYRKAHNEMDTSGRENYQRSVKTILQVGKTLTEDYSRETGLPIDIILQTNPYSIRDSAFIAVKILFKGTPLASHLCKLWHSDNGKTNMQNLVTNASGEVTVPVRHSGRWMMSAVNMVQATDSTAQWQSYWGSLTWGYY